MALGMMLVFAIAIATVLWLSGSGEGNAKRENSRDAALSMAEAGVANALSLLSNSTQPLAPGALPAAGSPQIDAVDGGTVSWYGTLTGDTWRITAKSSVASPTAGSGAISRTVSVDARVGSTAVNPAWSYVFSDAGGCLDVGGSAQIAEPVYTRGDLCLSSSATVTGSPVQVEGTIETQDSASAGALGTPIAELHVAGGCRYGASGTFVTPCSASEHVYATAQDTTPAGISKPPIDLDFWYANAKPGPAQSCTSGSFPGGFDNDGSRNGSLPDVDLFASNYDCTVTVGATQVGRIAYTAGNPGTFFIDGTVFVDGKITMNGAATVDYSGRGTIYASDSISLDGSLQMCAARLAGDCDFASWDPGTEMLVLVSGSSAATGFAVTSSVEYQGGIYAATDYQQSSAAQVQGPKIARGLTLSGSSQAPWVPYAFLPPGAPMNQPVVVTAGWRG
jgi:hypothetical protein